MSDYIATNEEGGKVIGEIQEGGTPVVYDDVDEPVVESAFDPGIKAMAHLIAATSGFIRDSSEWKNLFPPQRHALLKVAESYAEAYESARIAQAQIEVAQGDEKDRNETIRDVIDFVLDDVTDGGHSVRDVNQFLADYKRSKRQEAQGE